MTSTTSKRAGIFASAGFDAHLVKPVAEAQLFKALAAAAGKRRVEGVQAS